MEQVSSVAFDARKATPESIERLADQIRQRGQLGIHLFAPAALAVDRDSSLPIAVLDFYSMPARAGSFLDQGGALVVTRVDSRETFAALLVEPKEPAGPAPRQAQPQEPIPAGKVIKRFTLDVRERVPELTWKAGTYLVDVMLGEETSNRARVELSPGQAAESDPAIAEFLRRQRSREPAPALYPGPRSDAPYPSYRAEARTPAVPEAEAIVLQAERVQVSQPEARSILRGSFRLTLPPRFLFQRQGESATQAVVPITLVMMGNLRPDPSVLRLVVPAAVASEQRPHQVAGVFNVDLFALRDAPRVAQTYTVFAYCGDIRSAPVKVAYVTPEMIRD